MFYPRPLWRRKKRVSAFAGRPFIVKRANISSLFHSLLCSYRITPKYRYIITCTPTCQPLFFLIQIPFYLLEFFPILLFLSVLLYSSFESSFLPFSTLYTRSYTVIFSDSFSLSLLNELFRFAADF